MPTRTITQRLDRFFNKPLSKLSLGLRLIAKKDIPKWDELTASGRRAKAEVTDRWLAKCSVKDKRHAKQRIKEIEDRNKDPRQIAQNFIDWYDGKKSLSAAMQFGMSDIAPRNAAMILCRLNPLDDSIDPLETNTGETDPDDFKNLLAVFEDVARTEPQHRTLEQWVCIAQRRNLDYHSWIDRYLLAVDMLKVSPADTLPVVTATLPEIEYEPVTRPIDTTPADMQPVMTGDPLPGVPADSVPVVTAKAPAMPKGITKQQILIAFGRLVSINLRKALGNGTGLFGDSGARTQKGGRGANAKHVSLWNPVIMAFGLKEQYSVPMLHLKSAFSSHSFLKEWLDNWLHQLDLSGE